MTIGPTCTCSTAWNSVLPPPPCPVHTMYTAPACNGHCHCHRHCCHCCHTHAPQTRWYTQTTAPAMPYIYGSSIQSTTGSGVTTNSGTTANINFSSGYQGPDEEPPAATAAPVS